MYIVGLGNPGEKYEKTRHNVGWMALDVFIAKTGLPTPVSSSAYVGNISQGTLNNTEVSVLYPNTFMNKSGSAVKKLVPKGQEEDLIVVHDDVDLPIGEIKIVFGRGDGGHNGIKSIVESLGTKDFIRVRIGVAGKSFWTGHTKRPQGGVALNKHVMGQFNATERKELEKVTQTVTDALEVLITEGKEKAMNKFNA